MKSGPALANLTGAIVDLCRAGLSPAELRDRVLPRLRVAVPFDAAFWATVDPATLLFTQPYQEGIPTGTIPYFVENEYLGDDVNKWTTLARDRAGVRTLREATAGELEASPRYRDVFRPLGLGDELRAVLRVGGACWGCVCLHRQAGSAFAAEEVDYVRRVAPRLAEGIRAGLLAARMELSPVGQAPGLLLLSPEGSLISTTEAGERWLDELGYPDPLRHGVPAELRVLAAMLRRRHGFESEQPLLRTRTRAGRWAVLHASRLVGAEPQAVAVIIETPSPTERGRLSMLAYGLTDREQTVSRLICRGLSTREISGCLHVTTNTVQDHLKSIFDKVGVRSRRELVTAILQEEHARGPRSGDPLGDATLAGEVSAG